MACCAGWRRDFRDARWSSTPIAGEKGGNNNGVLPLPTEGYAALFARLTYASSLGHDYALTTNVEVVKATEDKGERPEKPASGDSNGPR